MSRTVWFNCQAGVAGDMTMASLVDAGADADAIAQTIAGLGLDGYALMFERVQRCGVRSTWANVVIDHDRHDHDRHDHDRTTSVPGDPGRGDRGHGPHRPAREIDALLDAAELPERVRARARAVFRRLAAVEGAIHDIDPDDVELHEVGALDSIIDIVGVCAALESLGIDEIRCSPIAVGHGTIRAAHGMIPNPAPATAALLAEARVPTVGLDTTLEVSTPTGVALMTALASGFGPMTSPGTAIFATAIGYGAGTADTPGRPNVVQAVVGTTADSENDDDGSPVALLEVNVDDVTPEVLAHCVSQLLARGAHDAWITPIVMKKGRAAHTVSVLCDPASVPAVRDVLVRETGSLGVRMSTMQRWPQQRREITVDVSGHAVRAKVAEHRIKIEFDDAAAAAAALGLTVRDVLDRATALVRQTGAAPGDTHP